MPPRPASRPWAVRSRCGGSRAAAEPVADRVILAIEPESTVVARLSRSLEARPEAKRFIVQREESPVLDDLLAESAPYPASVYGAPMSDTCKEVIDGLVRATVPRESLVVAQGPWVFTREAVAESLTRVAGREAEIADLIGFCEAAGLRVRVLPTR